MSTTGNDDGTRLVYSPPRIETLGSLEELTLGGLGDADDFGFPTADVSSP